MKTKKIHIVTKHGKAVCDHRINNPNRLANIKGFLEVFKNDEEKCCKNCYRIFKSSKW
ncbi:hypothetical protein [Nitrosophilus labii]|uniref:hypothetical protein n=1 Tax=Nitrosophilus labii TaxID=2706014 RepID=UPI00165761FF|nr:hypothetical protein [Nitrosophilus labii]